MSDFIKNKNKEHSYRNKLARNKRRRERVKQAKKFVKDMTPEDPIVTDKRFIAASYSSKYFYNLPEWKSLRYHALKIYGAICMLCGASPRTGAVIHVDHILPRSIYPEKAFEINNLQILCKNCNEGKSNKDSTDWRDGGRPVKTIIRKKPNGETL